MKKILLFLAAIVASAAAWAQGVLGPIPEKVDYRDARIIDVSVKCVDVLQWTVPDPETQKVDTVFTANHYILWQSDGDLDAQAEARRANAPKKGVKRKGVTTNNRTGSLKNGWLATYDYMVYKYKLLEVC